jgi:tRNA 2-thiouridine synthesizing protein E
MCRIVPANIVIGSKLRMSIFAYGSKRYDVDAEGFLSNFKDWDEDFARGMAPSTGVSGELGDAHWKVISYIRDTFRNTGRCPMVYEACLRNDLDLKELEKLFPAGYLRGACRLAGITYREGFLDQAWTNDQEDPAAPGTEGKSYEVNVRGFLMNPFQWDDQFAIYKAWEMKMPKLTDLHWHVILYIRERFEEDNCVPTVYEVCQANGIDIEKLHELFPDGYHRGAVKLAGLRVR